MLEVQHVDKRFGRRKVLADVSFSVARGEIVGFVGPNGAGKTTTLRIITGYLDCDRGRVLIDGHDVAGARADAVGRIGYLPENAPLYGDMRVDELLRFRAALKGVPRRERAARLDEVTAACGLDGEHRRRLVGQLSKGYRQRVGLADALLGRPPLLVLDEPASGLDPVQNRELRRLLVELARDRTVILSSHILSEIERVADRVLVLAAGRVVADAPPHALAAVAGLEPDADLEDVFVALTRGEPG